MNNEVIKQENDKERAENRCRERQSVMFQVYTTRKRTDLSRISNTSTEQNVNTVLIMFHMTCQQTCSSLCSSYVVSLFCMKHQPHVHGKKKTGLLINNDFYRYILIQKCQKILICLFLFETLWNAVLVLANMVFVSFKCLFLPLL